MTTIKTIGVARRLTRTAVGILLIVLTTDETDDERYFQNRSGTGRSTGLRSEIFWPGARWNQTGARSDCGRDYVRHHVLHHRGQSRSAEGGGHSGRAGDGGHHRDRHIWHAAHGALRQPAIRHRALYGRKRVHRLHRGASAGL